MEREVDRRVLRWVRPEIRALSAYAVPDARGLIKLDAMENPYGWPDALVESWLAKLRDVPLNRYPDPGAAGLKTALRTAFRLPADMDLLLGNGSDELIQMLAMAVSGPGRSVMAPEPSFVMYRMIAGFVGMDYVGVPLHENDFSLDLDATLQAIEAHDPALIFLAYPNNPTGNLFDKNAVRRVIEAASGLVVVDEAYTAFAESSCLDLLGDYPNLLVMRTVSKMGLAGLRLGLLIGPDAWLSELDKVRLPYNINVLTQASAEFALEHRVVLDEQTETICTERERLYTRLRVLPDIEAFPSQANFILFRTRTRPATEVFEALRADGVLLKNLSSAGGPLRDCLRVTVGTPEENEAFLGALLRALRTAAS